MPTLEDLLAQKLGEKYPFGPPPPADAATAALCEVHGRPVGDVQVMLEYLATRPGGFNACDPCLYAVSRLVEASGDAAQSCPPASLR